MEDDKILHLVVSFVLVWIVFGIFRWCRYRRNDNGPIRSTWLMIAVSVFIAFLIGLIKELNDYLGIGKCPCKADPLDILSNFYGILAAVGGLVLFVLIETMMHAPKRTHQQQQQTAHTGTVNENVTNRESHLNDTMLP